MKQQIIGIERVMLNRQKGLKWNNKKIRWSIAHNFNNESKAYDIELQMVLVSSKRIVKVNDQIKNVQMCSFGYEAQFGISDKIKGYIKQDGLSFELYLNGNSFTKLQALSSTYSKEPPKISGSTVDSLQCNTYPQKSRQIQNDIFRCVIEKPSQNIKKQSNQFNISTKKDHRNSFKQQRTNKQFQKNNKRISEPNQIQVKNIIQQFSLKQKSISSYQKVQKKTTQNSLKDTHNQLMRILIQQKKRKKMQKQLESTSSKNQIL